MTARPDATPRGLWAFVLDNSLLLAAGTVEALTWANIHFSSYVRLSHALHFVVNDVGMVFFFALAVKEIIEATVPGGPLESPREALVPVLAAAGGMMGPAALFVACAILLGRLDLMPGWAIPCATDIAFSYLVARAIFPRAHPAIPFLLLLAIADDALGLILLAVFYPVAEVSLPALVMLMIPAIGISAWLRARRTTRVWPYVMLGGGLSWAALFFGGVQPALALVPILPFMPHDARDRGLFERGEVGANDTMNQFERTWRVPVQFILLLFGLANAGVRISSVGDATWAVFVSLLLGKPLGIVGGIFLAARLGLRAPGGLSYAHASVMAVVAAIGFTVALFFAAAAFPPGPLLDEAKMGALMSFLAAPIAIALGRLAGISPQASR